MNDLELAKVIAQKVKEKGGDTYFVGGFVRDSFLNLPNKDIDIELHNIDIKEIENILSSIGELEEKGKSFGVYGLKHSDLDIAIPRSETATGKKHTDFKIFSDPYISLEEATIRRDFTINAMMKNVLTDELVDLHGGLKDLQNKIIRCVSKESFVEDPLRVLRACQFAARFNFRIDDETLNLCKTIDLSTLSKERIFSETSKALLKSSKPSIYFEYLREMNQLDFWYNELKDLIGCEQDVKWHPEGDVWNHTMMVLDCAAELREQSENPLAFMFSALYHDIGKPNTTFTNESGIHSYNHEFEGMKMIKDIKYIDNNDLIKRMENNVAYHMRVKILASNSKNINKFCYFFDKCISPKDLILLGKADDTGRTGYTFEMFNEKEEKLNRMLSIYKERISKPQLTGKDLIAAGFEPGEQFKDALNYARKRLLEGVDKDHILKEIVSKMNKLTFDVNENEISL